MYIHYNIKITDKNHKSEKLDFVLLTDNDDVIEGYVLNPLTNQWCANVKQATSNWSEQDEDLNKLLEVLDEFTHDSKYDVIYDFNYGDVGRIDKITYHHNNEIYKITITVEDVED